MESTSFKRDLSVKLLVIPATSMGMMTKNSSDSLKELFCIYARISTPRKRLPEWLSPEKWLLHQQGNTSCIDDISGSPPDMQ